MATQNKDSQGNFEESLNSIGGQALVDLRSNTVNLGSLNAETVIDLNSQERAQFDLRGTFVATFTPAYSVDGVNYTDLPIFNRTTESFALNATTIGTYQFEIPIASKKIRIRCTAYTSGSAVVAVTANKGVGMIYSKPIPATSHVTATGTSGSAVTLTIPSVTGLKHYITRIKLEKFAVATLTAAATPVIVTTTNIAGSKAYSVDASAQVAGTIIKEVEDFINPLLSVTVGTATTIVAPVTTNVIWRISADYYLGL